MHLCHRCPPTLLCVTSSQPLLPPPRLPAHPTRVRPTLKRGLLSYPSKRSLRDPRGTVVANETHGERGCAERELGKDARRGGEHLWRGNRWRVGCNVSLCGSGRVGYDVDNAMVV